MRFCKNGARSRNLKIHGDRNWLKFVIKVMDLR